MSYKVIHYFEDLQDFNYSYKVGDNFPRLGLSVTEDRLKELASSNNKQGKPLIEKVKEVETNFLDETIPNLEVKAEPIYTKTEINRMSTAELKEVAKANGIKDASKLTGAELKKVLIKKFNL